ncbi:MAG: hypothetical protein L0228_15010 [Planctomycetes bacterium]|nr:hypothetical protein [Planctomycetota bacterium]
MPIRSRSSSASFEPIAPARSNSAIKLIGCRGYIQQDAVRISLNVLLYSLNQ